MKPKEWALEILLAIDRLGNALFRGDGTETISARAGRSRMKGKRWACVLCKLLDRIDPDHCEKARVAADERRRR